MLLISLGLAADTSVLAGIAAGCLIIKPRLRILLPVCYVASHNFVAIRAALFTILLLFGLSWLTLNPVIWAKFLHHDSGHMLSFLTMPWEQSFQNIMAAVFITARSLGATVQVAYMVQIFTTIAAAYGAWVLGLPGRPRDPLVRLLIMLCLVALTTPYGFIYDMSALSLMLVAYVAASHWRDLFPWAFFSLVTSLYILRSLKLFSVGSITLAIAAGYMWRRLSVMVKPTNGLERTNAA